MECAGKGSRTPCCGPPTRRCHRCQAVAYCSLAHQLAVFGELQALFPGVKVHIDLVGPAIPQIRDGERIDLNSYIQCNEMDCGCKHPVEYQKERIITSCCSYAVKLQLHAGCYHDCYGELLKDSLPHIILAPNAGIAAYTSWVPTLEVIKQMHVPLVLSDYCEEASHLAASCISSTTGTALKIQIQINPFRQPFRVEESALCLPCYSNCFVFGF
ncbi:zinc ion binding [Striga hermonthica]|uniref:Zinc ion binding n=1 Tax=Striga hermonthica TaxID=68872 RepID=A0A9N7NKU5_STRHE|nr:zinc ion binding [Striga hermonthica]